MGWDYAIKHGEIPQALKGIEGKFHAMITDAPYEFGFMGRGWDSSGVSFRPETWAAILDLMYPGAFGVSFAGGRTAHRIACAIEDAGAIIHPTILAWVYSSGFPKATRIDLQLDRRAGVAPKVVGHRKKVESYGAHNAVFGGGPPKNGLQAITEPGTAQGVQWRGHRYGLQAMAPANEPIILFQKPYESKAAFEDIVKYGAGALNIAGSMIDSGRRINGPTGTKQNRSCYNDFDSGTATEVDGHWPKNLILMHQPDCDEEGCALDCAVGAMDPEHRDKYEIIDWAWDVQERIGNSQINFYSAKAMGDDRHAGIEAEGEIVSDGRHTPIDNPYLRGNTVKRNTHPTVKPLKLTHWLARLLLPPAGYHRKLLIPFSGSGSEMIGACLAGWDHVQGIELRAEAVAQAQQRLTYWEQRSRQAMSTDPQEILRDEPIEGLTLLDRIRQNRE